MLALSLHASKIIMLKNRGLIDKIYYCYPSSTEPIDWDKWEVIVKDAEEN